MSDRDSVSKINSIFRPKSIAVVGASSRKGTVGNDVLRNLLFSEYQGPVFPVNPKANALYGVHCYKGLSDLPEVPELAVMVVPPQAVITSVQESIKLGVKAFCVISAGFKEVGGEGIVLQNRLSAIVKEAGTPLVGPNCLGVINTDDDIRLNATFARKMPAHGTLAFVSQSGALCTSVLDYAEERGMGFSKFVSFGNKGDVNEIDLLDYLAQDEKTKVIAMYLEDIQDGRRFIETVRRIFWETGKPMLCLKSGRSAEGAKAVSSHTGSLAGSDSIYDALLIQSGVQRVDTISELFDYASLYTTQPLPRGGRVAIITNAGGPGIMATDAAVRFGLTLAELTDATKEKLRPALPPTAALHNPVDVIGDAHSDRYKAAIRTVMEDENVDLGVVILTPQSMTDIEETAAVVPEAIKGIDKPVVCSFMGVKDVAAGVAILRKAGVPNYAFPEDAVKSLAASHRLATLHDVPRRQVMEFPDVDVAKASQIIQEFLKGKEERYLTQAECRSIFECYKLPVLKSDVAKSADEAVAIARRIESPVAMKIMSGDVVHKFDAGGVMLKVQGDDAARRAYDSIISNVKSHVPNARIDGVLVEQMAKKGPEVIIGATRDARFGALIMFGLGGTLVEVLKDVSFRLAPMWQISAEKMVREIKAFQVLDGFRGTPPADIDAIVNTLLRVSTLVCNHPEIAEMDINPLIVHAKGEGASVADGRIMLRATK